MSSWKGDPIIPDPKEIAAYGDGEFEVNPQLEPLRRKVEKWLADHPEAADQLQAQRRLAQLWQATTPLEPDDEAVWASVFAKVSSGTASSAPPRHRPWALAAWGVGVLATAAAVLWLVLTLLPPAAEKEIANQPPPQPAPKPPIVAVKPNEPIEVFEVATAAEIEIVHVGGADTGTLVVGDPPVQGVMDIAAPGEIAVTRLAPAHDNTVPEFRGSDPASGLNPMIWSKVPGQQEQP